MIKMTNTEQSKEQISKLNPHEQFVNGIQITHSLLHCTPLFSLNRNKIIISTRKVDVNTFPF